MFSDIIAGRYFLTSKMCLKMKRQGKRVIDLKLLQKLRVSGGESRVLTQNKVIPSLIRIFQLVAPIFGWLVEKEGGVVISLVISASKRGITF
jgi:hypothetical protein